MLILKRRPEQSVYIGSTRVLILGIDARPDVAVMREELYERSAFGRFVRGNQAPSASQPSGTDGA